MQPRNDSHLALDHHEQTGRIARRSDDLVGLKDRILRRTDYTMMLLRSQAPKAIASVGFPFKAAQQILEGAALQNILDPVRQLPEGAPGEAQAGHCALRLGADGLPLAIDEAKASEDATDALEELRQLLVRGHHLATDDDEHPIPDLALTQDLVSVVKLLHGACPRQQLEVGGRQPTKVVVRLKKGLGSHVLRGRELFDARPEGGAVHLPKLAGLRTSDGRGPCHVVQ
mmetsp:Transcript_90700/g.259457  ORF Transcript_90700/g.259457 Transcript_90700/m.259457 type:complete len:228 (-) Transcript_90700:430-1113(-)